MRVSLDWLRDFVSIYMTVEELAHALTMAGLEVEAVEKAGEDYVLEINVTPNRPDCLSVLGIAREVAAITQTPLKSPESKHATSGGAIHKAAAGGGAGVSVEIADKGLCRRYAGRVIKGVSVSESPEWIKGRLEKCGLRPINNIVDVTNYLLLELGHPMHAFDLRTLKGNYIKVAVAGEQKSIVTLDGAERRLPEDALLIRDAERPVAVAGVMGGAATEVGESTKDVFLESAWFRPDSVRRTAKRLGLKTESSYRFERGADMEMIPAALERASLLISELAGGAVSETVDVYPERFVPVPVSVRYDRVNLLLGTKIERADMTGILKRLGLEVQTEADRFTVTPPSFRLDLLREADIIEEIARLYGYERIPTSMPLSDISPKGEGRSPVLSEIREVLRKEGLHEAINYSFMDEKYLDVLNVPAGDRRRRAVRIRNPLRAEDALLRTMLTPSLMENFIYNFFRGVKDIRLFELSKVFEDSAGPLPDEHLRAGGIFCRDKSPSLYKETAGDFYIVKGAVESLFDRLRVGGYSFRPCREPFLHAGKSADIYLKEEKIGFVGALSPGVIEHMDIKAKPEVFVFELDIGRLISSVPASITYAPIPKFPAVERDIAIVLDADAKAADVIGLLRAYPTEFVEDVSVFDSYAGPGIAPGKKSLAFAVRYRARERTLTDEEVETLHASLVKHLVEKTGGEIRGS